MKVVDESYSKAIGLNNEGSDITFKNVCMFWYIDDLAGIKVCNNKLLIKTHKINKIAQWNKRKVITYPDAHVMKWNRWVEEFGLVFDEGYEVTNYKYYPRGRVSYLKMYNYCDNAYENVFELVMDKCLFKNDSLIEAILVDNCKLQKATDRIFIVSETEVNDEHYICHNKCCGNEERKV